MSLFHDLTAMKLLSALAKKSLPTLIILLAPTLSCASADAIRVTQAWIAEAPPVSRVHAGYMTISNQGGKTAVITGMECDKYARTEFHRTVDRDGIAGMERLQALAISPGESLEMSPGGYHVMLFNPVSRLRQGDRTDCRLILEDGSHLIDMLVRKSASMMDHSHHNHPH